MEYIPNGPPAPDPNHPFPDRLSLSTTYARGCRCNRCRRHNAERIAAYRASHPRPGRAIAAVRQPKVRPTSTPRRQGYVHDGTLSAGDWARVNNYDASSRTYQDRALTAGVGLGGVFLSVMADGTDLGDILDPVGFCVEGVGEGRQGKTTLQTVTAATVGSCARHPKGGVA